MDPRRRSALGEPEHQSRWSGPSRHRIRVARIVAASREEADAMRRGDRKLARPRRGRSTLARIGPKPSLFTATIAYADGGVMIQAFHASVARHPTEIAQRLRSRFGDEVVSLAELRAGFHPAAPVTVALVPAAVADMIRLTEQNCGAPAALTFAVDIEHRVEI